MASHYLERTSIKDGEFIGKCLVCGKENLTLLDLRVEVCPNPDNLTEEEKIVQAIFPPKKNQE